MKTSLILVLTFVSLITAYEVGYIGGTYASAIMGACLATSFLFSMAKGTSVEDEEVIETRILGMPIKIRGASIFSGNLLIIVLFSILAFLLYTYHQSNEDYFKKILEATAENTYVLSLSQADRDKLNIVMPESLRQKLRRHDTRE